MARADAAARREAIASMRLAGAVAGVVARATSRSEDPMAYRAALSIARVA
jgi:hypothetical protein